MAVDTATKRASAMNFGVPWNDTIPMPDGTVWDADRAHLLGLYSAAMTPAPSSGSPGPFQGLRSAIHVVSAFRI